MIQLMPLPPRYLLLWLSLIPTLLYWQFVRFGYTKLRCQFASILKEIETYVDLERSWLHFVSDPQHILDTSRLCCQTTAAGLRVKQHRCVCLRLHWYDGQY